MDREQFWALIEAAKAASGGDCRAQTAQLVAALSERSVDEVLAWDRIHGELLAETYGWDLWGAAYQAHEALTGQEFTVEVAGMRPWPPPLGQGWDFDDGAEMQRRYPRLWAICGWDEASSGSS